MSGRGATVPLTSPSLAQDIWTLGHHKLSPFRRSASLALAKGDLHDPFDVLRHIPELDHVEVLIVPSNGRGFLEEEEQGPQGSEVGHEDARDGGPISQDKCVHKHAKHRLSIHANT